jgi:thioredoxin 1
MKEITSSEFESEVLRSDVPVLVDFYTEGCGPCRQMSPILGEIEAASSGVLKVVKMDASADAQFSASFQISAVPTLLLFHRGQQLGQVMGARSKRDLKRWIDESLGAGGPRAKGQGGA